MNSRHPASRTGEFERLLADQRDAEYVLTLYVIGLTPRSLKAVANIRSICAECLANRHRLSVIDITQQPQIARDVQIVAAPTLIKTAPLPIRRLVGDLSDRAQVLRALGLPEVA